MRRAEKARQIGRILDEIYPEQPIPLTHSDPYTLLVAVMLSAQTTDKKVNEVTPKLFESADSPERMASLEVEQLSIIHISEPTRPPYIPYAVFCLKKKKKKNLIPSSA